MLSFVTNNIYAMKTKIVLGLLLLLLAFMQGCEKSQIPGKGKLELSIGQSPAAEALLKSADIDTGTVVGYSYYLVFSVETINGDVVFDSEMVPLMVFGSGFLSPSIEMEEGNYYLTELFVVNTTGEAIMAAPRLNSEYAYLVNSPLPIEFNINTNGVSRVSPEVLNIGDAGPGMFGYAEFDVTVVNPLKAHLNLVCTSANNALCGATMVATSSYGWAHKFSLQQGLNELFLREDGDYYMFEVYGDDGQTVALMYTMDEIRNSSPESPLMIDFGSAQLKTLVLQPAAADGMDATIIDLKPTVNYGSSNFFTASYMSEPILTVMRTTNSLIYFNGLGAMPKSATIQKVTLRLALVWDVPVKDSGASPDMMYYWPRGVLKQIVEPWEENTVTWGNQPKTIDANQVYIDIDPSLSTIYRTFDVTSLFVPYTEVAAPNYGMMLSVTNDNVALRELCFASSDHPQAELRPKLTVYYKMDEYLPD